MISNLALPLLLVCFAGDAAAAYSQLDRLLVPLPVRPPIHPQQFSSMASDECVDNCTGEYYLQYIQVVPNRCNQSNQSYTEVLLGEYDSAKLQILCRLTDSYTACLKSCNESSAKSKALKYLVYNEFVCNNSTIKDKAPCIKRFLDGPGEVCKSEEKCGKHWNNVNSDVGCDGTVKVTLDKWVKDLCLLATCGVQCAKDVATVCGEEAYRDVQGATVRFLLTYKAFWESAKTATPFPEECQRALDK